MSEARGTYFDFVKDSFVPDVHKRSPYVHILASLKNTSVDGWLVLPGCEGVLS